MLATSDLSQFLILAGAGVIGAIILGIGRSGMKFIQKNQTKKRQGDNSQRILTEFLFDVDPDPVTHTPGRKGWTTLVNEQLSSLEHGLREVLAEVKPDHNGRHNLRGTVERTAEAAGVEVVAQTQERERVQERDRKADET